METAILIVAGWCSGINAYLTVLILGMSGRAGWAPVPTSLQQNWVLGAAALMFAIEFILDKVPLVDSMWDLVHTAVRPAIAGTVAAALATGQASELGQPQATALAIGLALVAHLSKSTTRLAINMSPEPASNILASLGEDGMVASLMSLALISPKLALGFAGVAMVIGVIVAFVVFRLARRGWRVVRRRLNS